MGSAGGLAAVICSSVVRSLFGSRGPYKAMTASTTWWPVPIIHTTVDGELLATEYMVQQGLQLVRTQVEQVVGRFIT